MVLFVAQLDELLVLDQGQPWQHSSSWSCAPRWASCFSSYNVCQMMLLVSKCSKHVSTDNGVVVQARLALVVTALQGSLLSKLLDICQQTSDSATQQTNQCALNSLQPPLLMELFCLETSKSVTVHSLTARTNFRVLCMRDRQSSLCSHPESYLAQCVQITTWHFGSPH